MQNSRYFEVRLKISPLSPPGKSGFTVEVEACTKVSGSFSMAFEAKRDRGGLDFLDLFTEGSRSDAALGPLAEAELSFKFVAGGVVLVAVTRIFF